MGFPPGRLIESFRWICFDNIFAFFFFFATNCEPMDIWIFAGIRCCWSRINFTVFKVKWSLCRSWRKWASINYSMEFRQISQTSSTVKKCQSIEVPPIRVDKLVIFKFTEFFFAINLYHSSSSANASSAIRNEPFISFGCLFVCDRRDIFFPFGSSLAWTPAIEDQISFWWDRAANFR